MTEAHTIPRLRLLSAAIVCALVSGELHSNAPGRQKAVQGSGTPSTLELSSLNGQNGFVANGISGFDGSGVSVAGIGDINNDGWDDVMIGAAGADGNGLNNSGQCYVIFGKNTGFNASLDLSTINGNNGFVINGVAEGDSTGFSGSAAGDVNGDGIDDAIIGARFAGPNSEGAAYVVFGKSASFGPSLNLSSLNGINGFAINGINPGDKMGYSVSGAGDVNGDGIDDVILGSGYADPGGASYVVFGKDIGFTASLNLSTLNGSNGFAMNHIDADDYSGHSVSGAGDINGDGIDDIVIGAYYADPGTTLDSGETYVVFGKRTAFSASLDLSSLNGNNGFTINGIADNDYSGRSVSAAGDINGDGFDDLIIGAEKGGINQQGQAYVIFGKNTAFSASFNLTSLNGNNGFLIQGLTDNDSLGYAVNAAGDVNGDGIDDVIISAQGADPDGSNTTGASYVVFGSTDGFATTTTPASLAGIMLHGIDPQDRAGRSVDSAGDLNADGVGDVIVGAVGGDAGGNVSGESYIVFGEESLFIDGFESDP